MTLVSVCIPAYNSEEFIAKAIDSILNQTYKSIEIIVCNDGSTDNTHKILDKYIEKGVKVIYQENRGQCAAANTAFKASTGDYIKFFDADDILSPEFIENQIKKINGRKDAIASAEWGRFYNNDIETFKLNPESVWRDMKSIDWLVESLYHGPNMMQCALFLIPRNVLEKSGLWDERLSLINDFDFFIRVLLSANEVLFTNSAKLFYRSGLENSLSRQKTRKAYESAILSTELGVESLLSFENSERVRKICADAFQNWVYETYPYEIDLYKKSKIMVKNLGGSDYKLGTGGITKILSNIFGWRVVRKVKYFFNII